MQHIVVGGAHVLEREASFAYIVVVLSIVPVIVVNEASIAAATVVVVASRVAFFAGTVVSQSIDAIGKAIVLAAGVQFDRGVVPWTITSIGSANNSSCACRTWSET